MSEGILKQSIPFAFDTAEWGNVLWWEEVGEGIGIYELETDRDGGIYIVDKVKCAGIISNTAFKYGIPFADEQFVFFDYDNGRFVLLYELYQYQLAICTVEEKKDLEQQIMQTRAYGAEHFGSYFGPWVPQQITPWGQRKPEYIEAGPGIWFVQVGEKWYFSICTVLYESLEDHVKIDAKGNRGTYPYFTCEDLYWTLEDCAPVIHALLEQAHDLNRFITSKDDLMCCLCECFPAYALIFNSGIQSLIKAQKEGRPDMDVSDLEAELITNKRCANKCFLNLPI